MDDFLYVPSNKGRLYFVNPAHVIAVEPHKDGAVTIYVTDLEPIRVIEADAARVITQRFNPCKEKP